MSITSHPEHGAEDLCQIGARLYEHAVREGRITAEDATPAPCLLTLGLLRPSLEELDWLEPVAPVVALQRLLKASEQRIADERRREEQLSETFEPLMRIDGLSAGVAETPMVSVLSGLDCISQAIDQAMANSSGELLAIQPHITHTTYTAPTVHVEALARDQALLDRGGCIRTLYQHTLRHAPSVIARYEQLRGDVAARTLDEIPERLIIIDRSVAFIPASKDRKLALEIRQPGIITFLSTTFERFWRLATPMYPQVVQLPTPSDVTPRQRAIAALLVEGHTDDAIADRLGLNVRTARVHIAKLAATLGSDSRAQLGYLIGQSGILDQGG
ncbi:helix-turn-helix transcriptional regulator [Streptomyces sp. NPDC054940]